MPNTIVIFSFRDYDYHDIEGVYSCDHAVTEDDYYDFAEIQEAKRKEVFQSFVKLACERDGIPYDESVTLAHDAQEHIAYKAWEETQPPIFNMFKEAHNLKPVNYIEVI